MSQGQFQYSKYETDEGDDIHPIRIQPETLTLQVNGATNTAPAGDKTSQISANATGSLRQNGLNARRVRIRFGDDPPQGYKPNSIITLPVLRKAAYDTMIEKGRGEAGTYQGAAVTLVGWSGEAIN